MALVLFLSTYTILSTNCVFRISKYKNYLKINKCRGIETLFNSYFISTNNIKDSAKYSNG